MFATVGVIATIAIIAGALVASTYLSTSTNSITTQSVTSQSLTSTFTSSTISYSAHGWINGSEGIALHYPPATFGAVPDTYIAPIGPSVELGSSNTTAIQSNTLVAESFTILENTIFNEVDYQFIVQSPGPNLTMAVYVNGNLTGEKMYDLNLFGSIPSSVIVTNVISEVSFISFNSSIALPSGSIVTVAFLANGPLTVYTIGGVPGNSILVPGATSIPQTWTDQPPDASSGPVFLAVGELNP